MAGWVRVDWRASASLVGTVCRFFAVPLMAPLVVALALGESPWPFLLTAGIAIAVGTGLHRLDPTPDIGVREGFLMVSATWLAIAMLGAVPYLVAGVGTLAAPPNALFESMSGFTTTGATLLGDFQRQSRAMMLYRQLTQWLGGMGIVVLAVAILPKLSVGGAQLMDAEAPGPGIEKLTPRIAETARTLWGIYLGVTALEMGLLYALHLGGLAPEMTLYNAVAHGLTTMPTGGFSPEARSIEAFSAAVQWVIIPFMIAAGTNFALFWRVVRGERLAPLRDEEFRFYAGILGVVGTIVAALLFTGAGIARPIPNVPALAGTLEPTLRHALFQTVSIVTTTGYASLDFNAWGPAAQYVLLFAMFIGGSAGSTGGAIKIVRWLVVLKLIRRELFTTVHPDAVRPVRLAGRSLDERVVRGIFGFTLLYMVIFFVGVGVLALDALRVGYDLTVLETMSAVAATIGNVGPGFGAVGPMDSYLHFPWTSKLLMVAFMWAGRLEILPVLVLLTRSYWEP